MNIVLASLVRNNYASICFILGIFLIFGLSSYFDSRADRVLEPTGTQVVFDGDSINLRRRGATEYDLEAAVVAWRYFERNVRAETGFVDSVAGFPSGTLWDQGSYLFALLSANALGIIEDSQFDDRSAKLLDSLFKLPLFDGRLPNKVYNTQSLEMVNYKNEPIARGIGWSALDLARLLAALRALEYRYPKYINDVRHILSKWDLESISRGGELQGATVLDGLTNLRQEGRIGYEEYGARASAMWGIDVARSISVASEVAWAHISNVEVPIDLRNSELYEAITPVLSEPFILQALEFGLGSESGFLASRVYSAQEERYNNSGILTMVSEDHIDQDPYFLYSSVYSNGRPWAVVDETGIHYPNLRTISLKAAVGWDAVYGTDYTALVRNSLQDLQTPDGWMAGRYEQTGKINTALTANTNAVILEAIHYMKFGPLLSLK